jgi:hypothetical protein
VCLWNYLSLDIRALMRFCFDLFDQDLSGYLDIAEMHELLAEVYGDSFETNERISTLMDELDSNGDGRLSFEEFREINQRYPSMLFPAFRIQQLLRDKVMGMPFWNQALIDRLKMGAGTTSSIWEIAKAVEAARKIQSGDELGALKAARWRSPMAAPDGYRPEPSLTELGQSSAEIARQELLERADREWKVFYETQHRKKRYHAATRAAIEARATAEFQSTQKSTTMSSGVTGRAKVASLSMAGEAGAARVPAAASSLAANRIRTAAPLGDSGLGLPTDEKPELSRLQKRLQRVVAFVD